jgi:Flp pilus assembly pilin Flp
MLALLKKLVRGQAGLETLEWAIVAGLIVSGVIGACTIIGTWVGGRFTSIQTSLGL